MPRIRTIKPEFWSDEKLSTMSVLDRLVFLGLISLADDFGRVHDNVKVIDAFVFPNTDETVRESLANLSRMNRIKRGNASSGMSIIEIVNWDKHQKVDKPQPRNALPPIKTLGSDVFARDSRNSSELVESDSDIESNHSDVVRDLTTDLLPTTTDLLPTTTDLLPPTEMCVAVSDSNVTPFFVCNAWNDVMEQNCQLTAKRQASLRQRLKDRFWVDNWREALSRVSKSDFCRGVNGGWRADLDWFATPDAVVKVMEGKYDNRNLPIQQSSVKQKTVYPRPPKREVAS